MVQPPWSSDLKGLGHLGHDEAMEAGGREFSLHVERFEGLVTPWP